MSPSARDLQLTSYSSRDDEDEELGSMEEVRLLDSYRRDEAGAGEGKLKKVQVSVTGMTCAACSNSVDAALSALPVVVSASVALLQNRADVVFDSRVVQEDDIKNAVEDAGFEAKVLA